MRIGIARQENSRSESHSYQRPTIFLQAAFLQWRQCSLLSRQSAHYATKLQSLEKRLTSLKTGPQHTPTMPLHNPLPDSRAHILPHVT